MADRIPPHSEDAERSCLGAALTDRDAMMSVVEKLNSDSFYYKSNALVYDAIVHLQKENVPVDLLTVCNELDRRDALKQIGGRAYVSSLCDEMAVPSVSNIDQYIRIVLDKASSRELIKTAHELLEKGYDDSIDIDTLIDMAESSVLEVGEKRQIKDFVRIAAVLKTNIEILSQRASNDGDITGVTTGFTDMDVALSGLQNSEMIIIAARPSMGKTALALNIAHNAAKKGNKVIVFSIEMSKELLGERLLASEARVDLSKLKTGNLEQDDWDRISTAIDTLSDLDLIIDDTSAIPMWELKNKCRRMKVETGLDLVVIDYLQYIGSTGRVESRQQEISSLSRELKAMAKDLNCPVLVLSQLSRNVESRNDKRPIMSDLRESGSIEQDADVIMMLYREEYYNHETENRNTCEVIIAKNRNGATGNLELTWQPQFTRFKNKVKA